MTDDRRELKLAVDMYKGDVTTAANYLKLIVQDKAKVGGITTVTATKNQLPDLRAQAQAFGIEEQAAVIVLDAGKDDENDYK